MTVVPHETGTDVAVPASKTVRVDEYQELLAYEAYCAEAVRTWKKEQDRYRERIKELLGDAEVGVDSRGDELVTYAPRAVLRTKDLARDHPDLFKLFTREISVEKFDEEWFARVRPELYQEYQSRALVNKTPAAQPPAPSTTPVPPAL